MKNEKRLERQTAETFVLYQKLTKIEGECVLYFLATPNDEGSYTNVIIQRNKGNIGLNETLESNYVESRRYLLKNATYHPVVDREGKNYIIVEKFDSYTTEPLGNRKLMSTLILPIYPEYVEKIMKGEKAFEFRRNFGPTDVEKIIFLVVNKDKKETTGEIPCEASVDAIFIGTPSEIWDETHDKGGVDKAFWDEYYAHSEIAVAYHLETIKVFDKPQGIEKYGLKSVPLHATYIN